MPKPPRAPIGGLGFDYLFALVSGVSMVGVYIDGWAHNHISNIEGFWTESHYVLYGGVALVFLLTVGVFLCNARLSPPPSITRPRRISELIRLIYRVGAWVSRVLPTGYGISALGLLIYLLAGVGDFLYHSRFGTEARVELLLSPPHIGLLLGGALFRTGPLRAAWQRRTAATDPWWRRSRELLPMVLSATYLLLSLTFFTQYAHPFGQTIAAKADDPGPALGLIKVGGVEADEYVAAVAILSVLLQSALLMSIVLLLLWRWGSALPFGAVTLMLSANAAGMTWMRDIYLATKALPLIAIAVLAGLAADVLIRLFQPSASRIWAFRGFAFAVPMILYALYFIALAATGGGVWGDVPKMWLGLVILAGGVGWAVSFLVEHPPVHPPPPGT